MTNEEYVRSKWRGVQQYVCGGTNGNSYYVGSDGFIASFCGETENESWTAAAEFTRQREEKIRQVEEEIGVCEGCLRMWQPPFGNDYGGVGPMKRILAREQAALAELKRGMK